MGMFSHVKQALSVPAVVNHHRFIRPDTQRPCNGLDCDRDSTGIRGGSRTRANGRGIDAWAALSRYLTMQLNAIEAQRWS